MEISTADSQITPSPMGGREWIWLFGFLLLVSGPAWLLVMPPNLEIGALFYGFAAVIVLPIVTCIWFLLLRVSRRVFNPGTSRLAWVGWSLFLAGAASFILFAHYALQTVAFEAHVIAGPLRYLEYYSYSILAVSVGVAVWLFVSATSYRRAVSGYLGTIFLLGIVVSSSLAWYAHQQVKDAPSWKNGEVSEEICSALLTQDRFDCYQRLAYETNSVAFCDESRPDLSCARPFALKGDYTFCKNPILYTRNPTGWVPGEVELVAGGADVYKQRFKVGDAELGQVLCVAGLLHQKWRADCDWMPGEMMGVCRNQEITSACSALDGNTKTMCLSALAKPELLTDNWFDRNFQIWSKQTPFYTELNYTDELIRLNVPIGIYNSTQVYDHDTVADGVSIKRVFLMGEPQNTIKATFFAAASTTATAQVVENRVFQTDYRLREAHILTNERITFLGQSAALRTYGDADSYPIVVRFRVVSFTYKDAQYTLLFSSDNGPVDWESFVENLALE